MYPNISAEMARHGLTQTDLAERLHVTRNTVGRWLAGKAEISVDALIAMKRMFGVSIDYLLENERSKYHDR